MRAPLAPPRLSPPRKVEAEAHAVPTSSETVRPEASNLGLERGNICIVNQRMIDGGHRVLPDQFFLRHLRPQIARARAHIAMGQLEPGAGEGIGEGLRVLEKAARNLLVERVDAQRQVGGQHRGLVLLRRIVCVRDDGLGVLGLPLDGACRALGLHPLVLEEVFEKEIAPLRRASGSR